MLTIRLTRVGKKNSPAYRVVVADKKRAVKRKFIEILGHYNPTLTPKELKIDKERAMFWIGNGAAPSDTVRNLMCDLEILPKKDKINKVYKRKFSKKAIKEGLDKVVEAPKAEVTEEVAETVVEETPEVEVETKEAVEVEPEIKEDVPAEEAPAEEPVVEEAAAEEVAEEAK